MCYASFRKLEVSDSNTLSNLLLSSPIIYTLYFNPFNFEASTISAILEQISKDKFFAIELHNNFSTEIVGFYMLRGLDEGYPSQCMVFLYHINIPVEE